MEPRIVDPRSAEYRELFKKYILGDAELRDLSVVSGPDGQYAVAPPTPSIVFFETAPNIGGLKKRIDLQRSLDNQSGEQGVYVSARTPNFQKGLEFDLSDPQLGLALGQRKLSLWPFVSFLVVPNAWISGNLFSDPMGWLTGQFDRAWDQTSETYYLTGMGDTEPLGVMTPSPQGVAASRQVSEGSTNGRITLATLEAMVESLKPAYQERATWGFSVDAMKQVEGLRDANGQPVIRDAHDGTGRRLILNHVAYIYAAINATATNGTFADGTLIGFLADLSQYRALESKIRYRSSTDRLMGQNATLVIAQAMCDGVPANGEAFAIAKVNNP